MTITDGGVLVMQILFGILLLVHGLITTAIGAGSLSNPRGVTVPGTDWFPVALGQSWMLQGDVARLGSVLWLAAGIGLIATAAAVLGIVVPANMWSALGLASAVVGLMAVAVFFHPYYAIAIAVDVAIVAAATVFRATTKSVFGI
jgi:hypothetical protein